MATGLLTSLFKRGKRADGKQATDLPEAQSFSKPTATGSPCDGASHPLVGMMSNRMEAINTCRTIAWLSKARGVDVIFFLPEDVDTQLGIIRNAHGIKGGKWVKFDSRIPDVINLASVLYEMRHDLGDLFRYLEKRSYLTDDDKVVINKEKLHKLLLQDEHFKRYAIETDAVTSAQGLLSFLERNPDAVVKPVESMRGKDVCRISRTGREYKVSLLTESKTMSEDDFKAFVEEQFLSVRHIAQRYVDSRSLQGDPFDCRVHVEKNGRGEWELVKLYVRDGLGQKVISNVNQGGVIVDADAFFKIHRPDCWEDVMDELKWLAATLPYKFESLKGRDLVTIGFDVGVEKNGELHVFELNTFPDIGFILPQVVMLRSSYYKWLCDHVIGRDYKFVPKAPWLGEARRAIVVKRNTGE